MENQLSISNHQYTPLKESAAIASASGVGGNESERVDWRKVLGKWLELYFFFHQGRSSLRHNQSVHLVFRLEVRTSLVYPIDLRGDNRKAKLSADDKSIYRAYFEDKLAKSSCDSRPLSAGTGHRSQRGTARSLRYPGNCTMRCPMHHMICYNRDSWKSGEEKIWKDNFFLGDLNF